MSEVTQPTGMKGWVTYRPEIKVLDCTVRDGGLMNEHKFSHDFVTNIYQTCVAAGVDYMELGYKASKKLYTRDQVGAWRFCDENDLREAVGEKNSAVKLSAMADAERTLPLFRPVSYHDDQRLAPDLRSTHVERVVAMAPDNRAIQGVVVVLVLQRNEIAAAAKAGEPGGQRRRKA